jgi:predicted GNAT family acetyltransferase
MVIRHKQEGARGMFYVEDEGQIQAEMIFHMAATDHMVIEHTEVDEDLRGQNVGYKLVNAAVEYARQHHLKITVWCPFAKKVFDKKPDFWDVLVAADV